VSDDLSADDLSADDLSADDLSFDEIASDDLSADDLSADDLSLDDISSDDLSSDDLTADDLSSDDIITSDTAADDMEASGLDSADTLSDETEAEASAEISAEASAESSAETETETELDDFDAEISQIDDISDDFNIDLDTDDLSDSDIVDIDEEKDSEELEKLREEGATPVTFPPEDTSYLEEDEIGGIDDSDSLDLSDAVIDEPELSADSIVDGPATEPDIDIDSLGDFDTVETEEEGLEIPQDLDIDIDISAEETDVSELAKDDFNISSGDDFVVEESALSDDSFNMGDSSDIDDSIDQVIPEGFEAELEETPVPFDDDLEGHIAAEEIEEELELPEEAEEIEEIAPPPELTKPGKAAPAAGTTIIQTGGKDDFQLTSKLKSELKNILTYMDHLLESLPEEKIEEFARSEYFDSYKKLFKELGLV